MDSWARFWSRSKLARSMNGPAFFVDASFCHSRVGQAKVVLRLDVLRVELQRLLKGANGFLESILVVLRAAEVIPAFRVVRCPLQHFGEPFIRVRIIAQQNVVERDDFEIGRARRAVLGASGELGERSLGLLFPNACGGATRSFCGAPINTRSYRDFSYFFEKGQAEQEVSVGRAGILRKVGAQYVFRLIGLVFLQARLSLPEVGIE